MILSYFYLHHFPDQAGPPNHDSYIQSVTTINSGRPNTEGLLLAYFFFTVSSLVLAPWLCCSLLLG